MNKKISDLMSYMERKYHIPLLKSDLKEWLQISDVNRAVYDIYEKLSDIRDI